MANNVLVEFNDGGSAAPTLTAFTITVASLVTSASGVGRQADMVSNASTRYRKLLVWAKIKLGTSPTSNKAVTIYAIRGDAAGNRTDGAGASDAAWTAKNAQVIGQLSTGASASTGDVLQDWFVFNDPGPQFAIGIAHDSGVNLDSTGGNHAIGWIGENPEIQ